MNFKASCIPYAQTQFFSGLVLDYLSGKDALKPFYRDFPSPDAIGAAIKEKALEVQDRELLHDALQAQYAGLELTESLERHIELLKQPGTFTITTAHQPNIFTGPLYFIYKILHAVKLAAYCKTLFPQYNFVPVYYMGSEDADLDELGHIHLNGEKLVWQTTQKGAVGRMLVDEALLQLIKRIAGEIGVLPYGAEIVAALKQHYLKGRNIQQATLGFVNYLFGKYGLVIVVPDNAKLKSVAVDLFRDELLYQRSSGIVEHTTKHLASAGYKVQAQGRDINLFYLKDDGARLRIEKREDRWQVLESNISFNEEELMQELVLHPERFSPNVILRGVFQEKILPNIAFIGGGGELAYWLELKEVFNHYKVAYPLLVLRNSFLVIPRKQVVQKETLGFALDDLFLSRLHLQSKWVKLHAHKNLSVETSLHTLHTMFDALSEQAGAINSTLKRHIYALQKQSEKRITEAGKKFIRAEKKNHADAMKQIVKLRQQLFPSNNLQERIDNILPYYAAWGPDFIDVLYNHSFSLEQQFVVLEEA